MMFSPRFVVLSWAGLVALLGTQSVVVVMAQEPVFELHGGGAANPCVNLIMDLVMERSRSPIRLTYRDIANVTAAQSEFHASVLSNATSTDISTNTPPVSIDFGAGHIPLNKYYFDELKAKNQQVLHFPYVLSAVGLYHSVDSLLSIDTDKHNKRLNLTSCLIAKILKRDIVSWKDPAILNENPLLEQLADSDAGITVVRQNLASPITQGLTEYLHSSCPSEWSGGMVGDDITWPSGVVNCAGDMAKCLANHDNAIGFIDVSDAAMSMSSNHIEEVPLKNKEGRYHTSYQSQKLGGVVSAINSVLPNSATESFAGMDLIYQTGPDTWPIVIMNYVYVATNAVSKLKPKGQGLAMAFLEALYEPSYVFQCKSLLDLTPVPSHVRDLGLRGIQTLKMANPDARAWKFERLSGEMALKPGDLVLSERRESFLQKQMYSLVEQVGAMKNSGEVESLEKEVAKLKVEKESLDAHVQNLLSRVVQLEDAASIPQQQLPTGSAPTSAPQNLQPQAMVNLRPIDISVLDDDTAISEFAGPRVFDEDAEGQLQASLVLAAMSFAFWSIYFVWKVWRFFLKP